MPTRMTPGSGMLRFCLALGSGGQIESGKPEQGVDAVRPAHVLGGLQGATHRRPLGPPEQPTTHVRVELRAGNAGGLSHEGRGGSIRCGDGAGDRGRNAAGSTARATVHATLFHVKLGTRALVALFRKPASARAPSSRCSISVGDGAFGRVRCVPLRPPTHDRRTRLTSMTSLCTAPLA